MKLFTSNQVNHAYVVISCEAVSQAVIGTTTEGVVCPSATPEAIYFTISGANGSTYRSDLIRKDHIHYGSVKMGSELALHKNIHRVTLANDALKDGKPIAGQDYILRVVVNNYIGISIEDSQYWKYGAVRVTTSDVSGTAVVSVSNFYKKMATSLVKNMSREAVQLFEVYLSDSATATSLSGATKVTMQNLKDLTANNYKSILIVETDPDWILGLKQQKLMNLDVVPSTVYDGVTDVVWADLDDAGVKAPIVGTVEVKGSAGKAAADYEYFHMGERGDQYRLVGWPNYVPTKYLVDPSKTYDYVNIHYSYTGPNEGAQKSEKDITFLVQHSDGFNGITFANAINAMFDSPVIKVPDVGEPSGEPSGES